MIKVSPIKKYSFEQRRLFGGKGNTWRISNIIKSPQVMYAAYMSALRKYRNKKLKNKFSPIKYIKM